MAATNLRVNMMACTASDHVRGQALASIVHVETIQQKWHRQPEMCGRLGFNVTPCTQSDIIVMGEGGTRDARQVGRWAR